MPTLVLSTLALFGCVFLIYVCFHWLRDELNPKHPAKRGHRSPHTSVPRRPYMIRSPRRPDL